MTVQAVNTPRIVEINHDSLQRFSDSQAECRGFDSLRPLQCFQSFRTNFARKSCCTGLQQGISEIIELQQATLMRCDMSATRIGAWRMCARPVPPLTEASMWQLLRSTVLRPKNPNRRSAALSISPSVTWLPDEGDDLGADRLGADPRRWSWDGDEGWNRLQPSEPRSSSPSDGREYPAPTPIAPQTGAQQRGCN